MNEGQIYILQDVRIDLTMPDDTSVSFLLQRPNDPNNPFTFEMVEESPSGNRIYKDPSRTKQKSFCDYYPTFKLNYAHHRMFTTYLLVAKNIALKTAPGFVGSENYIVTNCLLENSIATKNSLAGLNVSAYSSESEKKANIVPSGSTQLTFIGKTPLTWSEALQYYFYKRRDSSELLASSSELISNPDILITE